MQDCLWDRGTRDLARINKPFQAAIRGAFNQDYRVNYQMYGEAMPIEFYPQRVDQEWNIIADKFNHCVCGLPDRFLNIRVVDTKENVARAALL